MGAGASTPEAAGQQPFWAPENVQTVSQATNLANHIVNNKGSLTRNDVVNVVRRVG
jgi:hypothetical protein